MNIVCPFLMLIDCVLLNLIYYFKNKNIRLTILDKILILNGLVMMKQPQNLVHPDYMHDWIYTNRIYEVQLFYYGLIIAFWVVVGFLTLGLELSPSKTHNLAFNFIYFLILCGLMIVSFWWFCETYERNKYKKYLSKVRQEMKNCQLTPESKRFAWLFMEKNGYLLPSNWVKWSFLGLGCCWLFELFFITSWVQDLKLVWQPNWVIGLIEWVRANTDFVSDEVGKHHFFGVNIKQHREKNLYQMFPINTERAFLASDFGASTALFQVWRSFTFPFVFLMISIILWKPFNWLGFSNIDPRYIRSIRKFIFAGLATCGMSLFLVAIVIRFLSLDISAMLILNISNWSGEFFWYLVFVFAIVAIKLIYGWFLFWKNLIIR